MPGRNIFTELVSRMTWRPCGLSPADAAPALLQRLEEGTGTMPFLRIYADALGERLVNRARWEPNDLIDMLYLACAAAYGVDVNHGHEVRAP
jgi:hypothetical protein